MVLGEYLKKFLISLISPQTVLKIFRTPKKVRNCFVHTHPPPSPPKEKKKEKYIGQVVHPGQPFSTQTPQVDPPRRVEKVWKIYAKDHVNKGSNNPRSILMIHYFLKPHANCAPYHNAADGGFKICYNFFARGLKICNNFHHTWSVFGFWNVFDTKRTARVERERRQTSVLVWSRRRYDK